jgi:RNA polymerase sigma-70 factor (ECF subfamily)
MMAVMTVSRAEYPQYAPELLAPASKCAAWDAETDLVARLVAGEEAAFEELVRRFGGRMLTTARRLLPQEEDARDAVQEAFLSAFKAIGQFTGSAKLSTWLHRITVNAALMKLRSRRRRPEQSIDDLLPAFDEHGEWVSGTASSHASSEVLLEGAEMRIMVRQCIDRLPEGYRSILVLRDIEDLDTAEVAEMLGITNNAVKIRLHRARQALRTLLERQMHAAEESHGG